MNNEISFKVKLNYIPGLKEVVLTELKEAGFELKENKEGDGGNIFIKYENNLDKIRKLNSIQKAFLVINDKRFNPLYISKHKILVGDLIKKVVGESYSDFKTFTIICAGSNSSEIKSIEKYIKDDFKLKREVDSDIKIHIIKVEGIWEVGIQITKRPLSVRKYRVRNMEGAMDSTIAYALNNLSCSEKTRSYLNIFSGSGTLPIEALLNYTKIEKVIGFDKEKKRISLAIQNIKEAGLIKNITLKQHDIHNHPDLGKFDVITSDLPFGMLISKGDDLGYLYSTFIKYCEQHLNSNGTLAVYTSKASLFEELIGESKFEIKKVFELKIMTNAGTYINPKIFICKFT